MPRYEYRAVPAPVRGEKGKGLRTTADRFARALTTLMNEMAVDGWEYLRAETLPCEERKGLTGKAVTEQHVLVFRRAAPETLARDLAQEAATEDRAVPPPPPSAETAPRADTPRLRTVAPGTAPRLGPARGED